MRNGSTTGLVTVGGGVLHRRRGHRRARQNSASSVARWRPIRQGGRRERWHGRPFAPHPTAAPAHEGQRLARDHTSVPALIARATATALGSGCAPAGQWQTLNRASDCSDSDCRAPTRRPGLVVVSARPRPTGTQHLLIPRPIERRAGASASTRQSGQGCRRAGKDGEDLASVAGTGGSRRRMVESGEAGGRTMDAALPARAMAPRRRGAAVQQGQRRGVAEQRARSAGVSPCGPLRAQLDQPLALRPEAALRPRAGRRRT